jgi:Tol biopolymer transport system component
MKRIFAATLLLMIGLSLFTTGCGVKKVKTYPLVFTTLIGDKQGIHLIEEDGGHRLVLSPREVWSLNPVWSPDATWIAFSSENESGSLDIWCTRIDGTVTRKLTNNGLNSHSPAWSPDGRRIAYVAGVNGKSQIYIMDLESNDPDSLTITGDNALTNGDFDNTSPQWSPDGRRILFISNRDANPEVYVMNSDGSNLANLSRNPATDDSASWSPDGRSVLFRSDRDGNQEIYKVNIDGNACVTGLTNLTRNPAMDYSPSWSHDGRKILFLSTRNLGETLFVMNYNGGFPTRLASPDFRVRGPVWSPDDKKIACAGFTGTDWEIFLLDMNEKKMTNLTKTPINEFDPVWAPR